MTEIPYNEWSLLSDAAIEVEIGRTIKKLRQQQGKTQKELAAAAGISRSTLSLLERGESGNLKTLIQILRVLDKIDLLQVFEYREEVSPLALAKLQHKPKERVRKSKKDPSKVKKSNW